MIDARPGIGLEYRRSGAEARLVQQLSQLIGIARQRHPLSAAALGPLDHHRKTHVAAPVEVPGRQPGQALGHEVAGEGLLVGQHPNRAPRRPEAPVEPWAMPDIAFAQRHDEALPSPAMPQPQQFAGGPDQNDLVGET